jgi:hypothetical protein
MASEVFGEMFVGDFADKNSAFVLLVQAKFFDIVIVFF